MSIALLCPTRMRPTQFNRMVKSALDTAHNRNNIKIYAGFTKGDTTLHEYNNKNLEKNFHWPDGMPTAFKWNNLAESAFQDTNIKLFMLCADDTVFSTPCWDKALFDHYNALENKIHVYHLLDSRNPDGTPHPIVTREYIESMGYFLPPMFLHWYVDTWTINIAKASRCFTHLKDYLLLHDKPSDIGKPDETHNKIRHMGWHERDLWTHEHCQHFLEFEKERLKKIVLGQMSMQELNRSQLKTYGMI